MQTKPTFAQFNALLTYLIRCEQAAVPPPPPPRVRRMRGLLDCGDEHDDEDDLSAPAPEGYPATLGDVMSEDPLSKRPAPYQAEGRLPSDRGGRVLQLRAWLQEFPAYVWMRQQLAIVGAEAKFSLQQQRRANDPKFADDIAIFRFWIVASFGAMFMDSSNYKPEPTAAKRKQAAVAARALQLVADQSALLHSAGLDYFEETAFKKALQCIRAMSSVTRRARNDEHTDDRKFIEMLADTCLRQFGDAPPVLVCELAALKVRSPDLDAIKKQLAALKKARGQDAATTAEG